MPALVLGMLLPLSTCERGSAPAVEPDAVAPTDAPTELRGWHYAVALAPSLKTAEIHVCFDGHVPERWIPGIADAFDHAQVRGPDGHALPRRGGGYALDALGDDACLDYTVDFTGLATGRGMGRLVGETGHSLMARPSAWLWRPDTLPAGADVTLSMRLPEGFDVSVPWPIRGDRPRGSAEATYVLDSTAFHWLGYAVFGEVDIDRFSRAGAAVELVTLDAAIACPPEGLRAWIDDAIDTVALLFEGRFPRDRLQVVVIPVEGGGGGTVYFGMAGRGGGPGVFVFLDDHATADELPGGWTTVHELLHHGMPFIDEPWMGEGWVSYYTELMRTRRGNRTELEGWQALWDAFERGQQGTSELSLAETSEKMHETHAYQRVYWGGASTALLADVQMRLETHGAQGLDDAVRELRRCCGDAPHMWEAQELMERLDAWYGRPLFSETAATVLGARELPDIAATLARLGVVVEAGKVHLDDDHPGAAARRAIMAPRP